MTGKELLIKLESSKAGEIFVRLYGPREVENARRRYRVLVEEFIRDSPDCFPRTKFPETGGNLRVFSAPGRTELGGNHTDHNRGKVLAASIQMDSVAIVAPRPDKKVFFRSVGHADAEVDLSDLSVRPGEKGHSEALIRGIAAEFKARGVDVGGFSANAASQVLSGSGLSSSAAVEVLFAKIFDNLYNGGKMGVIEIAYICQKAENDYFGKPCGLMDQTACASGGAVGIDFENPAAPWLKRVEFDLMAMGFALCVVNTRGSHADLTMDYAAIPEEMRAVAACLGKTVLREVDYETVLKHAPEIRKTVGDRAVLRALHFFNENRRVDAMLKALEEIQGSFMLDEKRRNLGIFLEQVVHSGDSSWELLQNIYSPVNPQEQGLSLALALTRDFLEKNCRNRGACRVHGGGFAGTIQVYIPAEMLEQYKADMEIFFGPLSVTVLRIRPVGVAELEF